MIAATPIQIGSKTIKNRITFAPTVKFDFTDDTGLVTQKHIDHYTERAAGGTGLICVEATAVLPGGRFGKNHMGLWSDEQTEGHKAIVEGCHRYGATVIIQLNHTGYVSNPECGEPVGPSEIEMENRNGTFQTKALTVDEIHEVQKAYVDAAVRAKEAGYDGIQLHGCHGYLINQFMSPVYNQRTDLYGGNAKNRARFGCEIIRAIREKCGDDFLVSVRVAGLEPTVEDAIAVAEEYVGAGCDYLQVSHGMTDLKECPPFEDSAVSALSSLGVYFHEHFKGQVPVSCVGGIFTPAQANHLLDSGYVDTVDVARAILADPGFANAVLQNTRYIRCYKCSACQYGPMMKHHCPAAIMRSRLGGH